MLKFLPVLLCMFTVAGLARDFKVNGFSSVIMELDTLCLLVTGHRKGHAADDGVGKSERNVGVVRFVDGFVEKRADVVKHVAVELVSLKHRRIRIAQPADLKVIPLWSPGERLDQHGGGIFLRRAGPGDRRNVKIDLGGPAQSHPGDQRQQKNKRSDTGDCFHRGCLKIIWAGISQMKLQRRTSPAFRR